MGKISKKKINLFLFLIITLLITGIYYFIEQKEVAKIGSENRTLKEILKIESSPIKVILPKGSLLDPSHKTSDEGKELEQKGWDKLLLRLSSLKILRLLSEKESAKILSGEREELFFNPLNSLSLQFTPPSSISSIDLIFGPPLTFNESFYLKIHYSNQTIYLVAIDDNPHTGIYFSQKELHEENYLYWINLFKSDIKETVKNLNAK